MRIIYAEPAPFSEEFWERLGPGPYFALHLSERQCNALRERGLAVETVRDGNQPEGTLIVGGGSFDELVQVVDRLLGPGGCPWDQAQTHQSLKKHLIEEAYEVLDAIDSGSSEDLKEELGDLLLQPVLHAQMRRRDGEWDSSAVAETITEKLVRRHPHVFGNASVADADEVLRNWDRIKQAEKDEPGRSILAGIPTSMPTLLRAYEISRRAARTGFEWPEVEAVFDKLREEENELRQAMAEGEPARVEAEVGDLLFTAVNLARWAGVEPEEALRRMLERFSARFEAMENLAEGPLESLSPGEWDALWGTAKQKKG